jgi:hypothetical protein
MVKVMNNFNEELWKFFDMVVEGENFCLTRFGDGELSIINGNNFDVLSENSTEFDYFSEKEEYLTSKQMLQDSFSNNKKGYYKGIPCHCCIVGDESLSIYDSFSDKQYLTWANVFVNSNYQDFNNYFSSIVKERKVYLISHFDAEVAQLTFDIEGHWKIGSNAWINNLEIIQEVKDYIEVMEIKDAVFLVAGGPFANIFCSELWNENTDNTYIDIGSTLDVYLYGKPTRHYHLPYHEDAKKDCVWFE